MASIRGSVPGTGYGNVYVDSLVWGGTAWNVASGPIKVWFGQSEDFAAASATRGQPSEILSSGAAALDWSDTERAIFDYVSIVYESVCGIDFQIASSAKDADIVWWKTGLGGEALGVHETPHDGQVWGYFDPSTPSWNSLYFGGDGLNTVLHEIGHGLGLAHPHDGGDRNDGTAFPGVTDLNPTGDHGLNQGIWTVMSYNTGWDRAGYDLTYGNQAGLGALDIAELQALYGKNTATGAANDVYTLPTWNFLTDERGWFCLWDSGGVDTINAAQASGGATIDLRAATLSQGDPEAGGFASRENGVAGGYTIANGVVIENATGTSSADRLQGNSAANVLRGNGKADILLGADGDDILYGGTGNDKLYGGSGRDTFVFDAKTSGSANVDRLYDFNPIYDSVQLDNKAFTKLGSGSAAKPKAFKADMFVTASRAQDREDRVVYDRKSGALYYDADGTGASAQVKIATLSKNLKLSAHDFFVI